MKKILYKDKPIIGLDISTTGIKVMSIDLAKHLVLGYNSMDLNPSDVKDSLEGKSTYLAENIALLIKENVIGTLASNHVVISIPTERTYSRTFTLPIKVEKSLKDAVNIEVEQYVPIPLDNLCVDYQIIERTKKDIIVLMSAVPKAIIERCTEAVESAGLIVSMIEPSINSLARIIKDTEDGNLPSVIVDIGPANTDVAIMDEGIVRITSSIPVGGNTFTLNIQKNLGVTLENAHQIKVLNGLNTGPRQSHVLEAVGPTLQRMIQETQKVMRYYNERINDGRKIEQLLIVGVGSNMPGIGEYFTNDLVMPARVASPWQKIDFGKLPEPTKQLRSRYLTVVGLACIDPRSIWQ